MTTLFGTVELLPNPIVTPAMREQFRFPRSKKKRIRKKWRKRRENWRAMSVAYRLPGGQLIMHPSVYAQLQVELDRRRVEKGRSLRAGGLVS